VVTLLALLTLTLLPAPAFAQNANAGLQGRVRDPQGAAIDGARVFVQMAPQSAPLRATQTDDLGFYRLERLPAGDLIIVVQRLGFAVYSETVTLDAGTLTTRDITLTVEAIEVEGLTVSSVARAREAVAFEEQAGLTVRTIDAAQLRSLPGFVEADPMRAAEALPGVITTSDFSAAFNVRGGSADQNLILLDGFPIFNPAHLGGLVSVFNPDMIERAELYSGGFPAEYGGRVSSVLAIETDPGDGEGIDVEGAISLLTSRISVAGGLSDATQSSLGLRDARWRVSGRRSYFDVLFSPFFDVPYRLADAQGTFEAWTRGGDRISITGYTGGDVLDLSGSSSESFPLKIDWNWGNDVIGGRWTKVRDSGGSIDVSAGYSRFATELRFPDFQDTDFSSRISQATVKVDWEERPMPGAIMKVGAEARQMDYFNSVVTGGTEFASGNGSGWGLATYGQLQLRPNDAWLLEAGLRVDGWYPTDFKKSVELAPRVSVKRFFGGGRWAVKGSVGRFTQFLQSLRDEDLPLGLDLWVLTGAEAPAVISDQAQLGVELSPGGGLFFSAEAYLREFDGVITNNFAEDPNIDFDEYLPGTGRSYGLDLFARKSLGRTTGWLSVSWLKTTRSFPDFNSGVTPAPQIQFPPIFDRRWDVDLVVSRMIGARIEAGLRWNFGTGLPFTQPQGSFPFLTPRFSEGRMEWDLEGADPQEDGGAGNRRFGVLLGPRNGARYPVRHRLDISIRKRYERSWGTFTPYLNVINLYNQKNVLFYFFEFDEKPPVRSGVSMFPLLPTFGVDIKFR
jgi:Carboxypeptidase regulatory-like domain/TonB-dependent Receptor Plug Domain/TonB dependent receptor-like, beta-barrel